METTRKIKELEKELRELEESNRRAWDTYGSELCAGEMSAKEKAIQDEIDELKMKEALIKQRREDTIKKWKKIGLLEGLHGNVGEQYAQLFKAQLVQMINDTPEPCQSLLLDDDLLLAIIGGGGERVTVRKGRRPITLGPLHFIGSRDKTLNYIVGVTQVRYLRIVDIDEDVIKAEGFDNWMDFFDDMQEYYPDLEPTDEITIIYFEIADVTTQ